MDYDYAKMILFSQSLYGEEKKWFRDILARSIPNFEGLQTLFIDRWEDKKSPLQILTQDNNLKRETFNLYMSFLVGS